MLGAWEGQRCLVVLVEQGEDCDVPVEDHVKHPLVHFWSLIDFLLFCSLIIQPKGLRAESTRAVTGRRCPHSGRGKTF